MQIKIAARHGHLNDVHQKQIQEKAEKLLHYFDRISMIEVLVDLQEKTDKEVEIKVDAEHKHDFVARESHTDLVVAVDLVLAKLESQLRRYKEKIQDHRRTPSTGKVAGATQHEKQPGEE